MPASQVAPFIFDDPAIVWLEHHGDAYGFQSDASPYDLGDFIAGKAHHFELKWLRGMALIKRYLEADCCDLRQILGWPRAIK